MNARFFLRSILAAAAAAGLWVVASPALAHPEHGQPAYGGIVAEAGAFQAELVAKSMGVTLFVTEHGKPVATQGATARLVVLSGGQKAEVQLVPAGDNRLAASTSLPIAAGAKVVASVKLADGRAGALRFEVK